MPLAFQQLKVNEPPHFTTNELRSYGLSDSDVQDLTERDYLEMDWMRQGHKMPLDWSNPRKGVNYIKPILKQAVLKCLRRGLGNRATSRETDVHTATIRRLRKEFDEIFYCKCGQVATHRGFCSVRFRRSIKRMEFMQHFTLHSPRHYIGLQIPISRWFTYRDPLKAFRSITKFLGMNAGATLDDWENIFQSQREAIIDAKIVTLVEKTEAEERTHLVRPTVSNFFRKLAVPSALQHAQDTQEA